MHTRGLSELIIKVDDVERAAHFYREVLGLTPDPTAGEGAHWFWTGEPGKSTRFALNRVQQESLAGSLPFEETSPLPPEARYRKPHFAFEVAASQLEAAMDRLRERGVNVMGPVRLDWMQAQACYFWDPEGHLLELWAPDEMVQGDRRHDGQFQRLESKRTQSARSIITAQQEKPPGDESPGGS